MERIFFTAVTVIAVVLTAILIEPFGIKAALARAVAIYEPRGGWLYEYQVLIAGLLAIGAGALVFLSTRAAAAAQRRTHLESTSLGIDHAGRSDEAALSNRR